MKKFIVSLTILLIFMGCATTGKTDISGFQDATKKSLEDYGKALIAKDIDAWLNLHDMDVIKMPQDSMPVVGMDALRDNITGGMSVVDILEFGAESLEFEVFGNFGYVRGNYFVERQLIEGPTPLPRFEGKYFTVYKKQTDGSWKIYRDSYSSNNPPVN